MIISFFAFAIVFSMVVLVHEVGHFIAARKSGVKVYEFSVGFPFSPRLCTLFHHKETAFTLRLLPLGGFVSFSKDGDEEAKDLFEASYSRRAFIMSAGSLFNMIFAFIVFVLIFIIGKHLPLIEAVLLSIKTIWGILSGTVIVLSNILSGQGGMEELSGPVGIAVIAGQAASKGFLSLVYFTGVLSMSIGLMNLFPFPALDGGHLFMLFIETIRKKPIGLKTYQAINLIGFTLFMILSVLVIYKDLVKLVA
jgi:regulator of sigma E protease